MTNSCGSGQKKKTNEDRAFVCHEKFMPKYETGHLHILNKLTFILVINHCVRNTQTLAFASTAIIMSRKHNIGKIVATVVVITWKNGGRQKNPEKSL